MFLYVRKQTYHVPRVRINQKVNAFIMWNFLAYYFFYVKTMIRSSHPEVFFGKGVLKICSKFIGEQQCRSAISIKLLCFATLLKSHFGMGVLLYICCIFSEHLFLRTPLDGCFWMIYVDFQTRISVPLTYQISLFCRLSVLRY